ncbi:hypothetical protein GCM10028812_05990 [Ancylobacter sonchi]
MLRLPPRLLCLALGGLLLMLAPAAAACPERPSCRGCGCKGGPGYRGPDGRCIGFADLAKVCGEPPSTRCVFENAPGTGANRECAAAPRQRAAAGAEAPASDAGDVE